MKDLVVLQASGYFGSVSINISAQDLLVKRFADELKVILDRYSISADCVYLELTETGAMEDPEAGIAMLNSLTKLGLKVAIDDFGTGYSSLSYLQRLPASEIKLDRSLVHDICTSENTAIIVETSINMIRALGYAIVAEGVENEQTANRLQAYRCDSFQGYWGCRPKQLQEIQDYLNTQKQAAKTN